MLGGSGDDLISSGDTVVESFIYGHEGHDEISPGDSITGLDTIKAGKGDDKINEPTYVFDMNGDVVATDSFGAKDKYHHHHNHHHNSHSHHDSISICNSKPRVKMKLKKSYSNASNSSTESSSHSSESSSSKKRTKIKKSNTTSLYDLMYVDGRRISYDRGRLATKYSPFFPKKAQKLFLSLFFGCQFKC